MKSSKMLFALHVLVLLSGFSGLVYQVTWQKYLESFLGSHALGTTAVLAVFFLALSAGNLMIGGPLAAWLPHNRIKAYAWLELGIGGFALLSPSYFELLTRWFSSAQTHTFGQIAQGITIAGLFLGLPSFLMGGTIPMLTQGLSAKYQASHRVHARIYSINTLGAFLGAITSGFIFIEQWGLPLTLLNTGLLNLLIAAVAFALGGNAKTHEFEGAHPEPAAPRAPGQTAQDALICLTAFFSGLAFFLLEGLIIRMAGASVGSSVYAYSMTVSAFILSIAIGAWLAARVKDPNPQILLIYYLCLFLALGWLYFIIPHWPIQALRIRFLFQPVLMNFNLYWLTCCAGLILTLLLPVGILGCQLPLLFAVMRKRSQTLASTAGRLYAINALGCAIGAILSYVLFLKLSADQIFLILLEVSLASAGVLAWLNYKRRDQNRFWLARVLPLVLMAITTQIPRWADSAFIPGLFEYSKAPAANRSFTDIAREITQVYRDSFEILYSKQDPNTWASVVKTRQNLALLVNGKSDASTGDYLVRGVNALVPSLIAPRIESIFITGLGAGFSTSILGAMPEVKDIEVTEISQAVIDALPQFAQFNRPIEQYRDKTRFTTGDAYQVLRNRTKLYDLMITEPSNPWVLGVEKLFTPEFLQQVRAHLRPDGVYAQWFPLFQVSEDSLLTVLSNFTHTFEWVSLWSTGGAAFLILASPTKPTPTLEALRSRYEVNRDLFKKFDFDSAEIPLSLQYMSDRNVRELAALSRKVHTIEFPSLQFDANRAFFTGTSIDFEAMATHRLRLIESVKPSFMTASPLLYEELGLDRQIGFLEKSIRRSVSHASPIATRRRLAWRLYAVHPNSEVISKAKAERVNAMRAWSTGKTALFKSMLQNCGGTKALYRGFWEMRTSGLPILRVPALRNDVRSDCLGCKNQNEKLECDRNNYELYFLIRGQKLQLSSPSSPLSLSSPESSPPSSPASTPNFFNR